MRRSLLVLAVLAAAVLIVWLASGGEWFGLFGGGARTTDASVAPDETEGHAGLSGRARAAPDKDPAVYDGDPVGRLELHLGHAAVSGKVTGAGSALRFARVVAVLAPPNDGQAVRTTKDGAFEIRGLEALPTDFRVSAEGFLSRTLSSIGLVDGQTTDLGTIDLKTRPSMTDGLEVKVTDEGGRPIAGAKVSATTMPYGLYIAMGAERAGVTEATSKDVLTDDLGVARFFPLPPEKYDVVIRAAGYALEAFTNVVVAAGRVEHVHVSLSPGLSMSGIVVDLAGAPVSGAHVGGVQMGAWRNPEAVMTDGSGAFTLEGLIPGTYMVFAGSSEKGEGSDQTHKAGDRGIRIQLKGVGTLVGKVVRKDGTPATSFSLRPYLPNAPFMYAYSMVRAFKDPEGRFRLDLGPGVYAIETKAEGAAFSSTTTAKVDLGESHEVTIVLASEGCVRGVVTDPDGNHLPGAEVYVRHGGFPPSLVRELYARTDADGHFELKGMPLESVKLYVRHAAYALKVFDATPAPPGAAKEVTVRLTLGARVEGRVLSKSGAPIEKEEVTLSQGFEVFDSKTTFTDANGGYAFPRIAAGTYAVTAGHFGPGFAAQTKGGVVVAAEGTVVVNFESETDAEASGAVTGRVTLGGAPVANADVSAWDERGYEHAVNEKTDADGKYLAKGLKPGRATVRVETSSGLAETHRVRIEKVGDTATLDFEFGRSGVEGTVVAGDGRTTVSGAWITVEVGDNGSGADAWSGVKAQLNTDGAGKFSAKGLAAGTYRVRIVGQGYAARITEPFAVADGESKDLGAIRLAAGGALSGRVTDDRGSPVENVSVSLKDARGQAVFLFNMVSTGSDGRFAMQGLELGSYEVRLEAKGFAPVEKPAGVTVEGSVLDAVMQRGGSLAAAVEDERGNPIEGARIELYDGSGQRLTKTLSVVNLFDADVSRTGAAGGTTIPDLAPGGYTVKVVKDGMVLAGDAPSVSVSPGATANVRLVLKPAP